MQLRIKFGAMVVVLLCIGSLGLAWETYSQFAVGGGFEVVLMISNDSDEEWTGEILIRKGAAQDWDTFLAVNGEVFLEGTGSVPVSIPPQGTREFVFAGDSEARAGYLEVQASWESISLDIALAFFYNFSVEGQLVDSTGVPASDWGGRSFVVPVRKSRSVDTGMAWTHRAFVDDGDEFNVILTLFDSEGNQVDQVIRRFTGHEAFFFHQAFDGVPDEFLGKLSVEAIEPLHLTVLGLETTGNGFQLTSVPPTEVF